MQKTDRDRVVSEHGFKRTGQCCGIKASFGAALVAFFCFSNFTLASEIDSFTRRFEPLENSAPVINAKANEFIARAIERANSLGIGCDEDTLYDEIKKDLNIILMGGPLIRHLVDSPDVAKHTLAREESIYKYFGVDDGFLLVFPLVKALGVGMGVAFNFNGTYVGSDKFEHIFGPGGRYFDSVYRKKEDLATVLYNGMVQEYVLRGGCTTGVYSYADLFAGFTGMRFWNHILQQYPDMLGENIGPYVQCQENRWVQVKDVDFGFYINPGFDEGYNCSSLMTTDGLNGVKNALSELNARYGTDRYKCPLDADVIDELYAKYQIPLAVNSWYTIADFIFNPARILNKYNKYWIPLLYFTMRLNRSPETF